MIADDSRLAVECAGVTIPSWNAAATVRDGVRAGGMMRVAARDDGATTNETPRSDREASYDRATGATEWGGAGGTVACDTTTAGWDAAPVWCYTGWWNGMAGHPQMRPGQSIYCRGEGAACSP